jgi:chromosome segregation ATPase
MPRTQIRTTSEISAAIADDRRRIDDLERDRAENAAQVEAKEAERDDRIADGGTGVDLLNREIAALRIEAEGYAGGIARLTRRITERETELKDAETREADAECDAAVARAVEAIAAMDTALRQFIVEQFTPLYDEVAEASDAAMSAERAVASVTGQQSWELSRVSLEGWQDHPGLDQIVQALQAFAENADAD